MVRLSEDLVNPYQAFAILGATAFAAALLSPGAAAGTLGGFVQGPLLPHAVGVLVGILGLQIGEAERGYGPCRPLRRAARLGGLVGFGLVLVLPFLLVHRVETGLGWLRFGGLLGFWWAYGLFWALAGHGAAAVVHWDGLRFVLKYGTLVVAILLPAGLPVSPIATVGGLWTGTGGGWWGVALYGGLDIGAIGAWAWIRRRS